MTYTVGIRIKKRVAARLRLEWSKQWKHTSTYATREEAEAEQAEWRRHPANRELEFKVIELPEIIHTDA